LRKRHPAIMRRRFLTGRSIDEHRLPDIVWHGSELNQPLWSDHDARLLAFTLASTDHEESDLHIVMNMSDEMIAVKLPEIEAKKWCVAVDTSKQSPNDIILPEHQKTYEETHYQVNNKSVLILESVTVKSPPI